MLFLVGWNLKRRAAVRTLASFALEGGGTIQAVAVRAKENKQVVAALFGGEVSGTTAGDFATSCRSVTLIVNRRHGEGGATAWALASFACHAGRGRELVAVRAKEGNGHSIPKMTKCSREKAGGCAEEWDVETVEPPTADTFYPAHIEFSSVFAHPQ